MSFNDEIDIRVARALLREAATRLQRVSGKEGVAGAVTALLTRVDEPSPQPHRPPDTYTDVSRVMRGLVAVCLAHGFDTEGAHAFAEAHASDIADRIDERSR